MMWSPLPQRYNFGEGCSALEPVPEGPLEAAAPFVPGLHALPEIDAGAAPQIRGAPPLRAPPPLRPSPLSEPAAASCAMDE